MNKIKIIYKDQPIAVGNIKNEKRIYGAKNRSCYLVSFDNTYYFNLEHPDIKYIEANKEDIDFIQLDKINIKSYISLENENLKEICYVEHNNLQLDYGVVKLVDILNKMDGVETTGSCDGHNKETPYVQFYCKNINSLNILTSLCNGKGPCEKLFYITTNGKNIPDYNKGPMFIIKSYRIKNAIKNLDFLCKKITEKLLEEV